MLKIFIVAFFIYGSCNNFYTNSSRVQAIKVSQIFPNLTDKGKLLSYDTLDVNFFYYNNYTLYYLSYQFDSTVEDIKLLSEVRYHYVFHEKGKTYGYDLDKHKSLNIRKVPMDSIYKIEWVFQINLCALFSKLSTTLLSSNKDNSGELKEHYKFKGIKDTSMSGMFYLEFTNKLKDVEFTLCKELDSMKRMKLQKILIVDNPRYYKPIEAYLEKFETGYWIEELKNFNSVDIKSLFEMFEKEAAKH